MLALPRRSRALPGMASDLATGLLEGSSLLGQAMAGGLRSILKSARAVARAIERVLRRRTVTVVLTDAYLKVVVFRGSRVVSWGEVRVDHGHAAGEEDQSDGSWVHSLAPLLRKLEPGRHRLVLEVPLSATIMRSFQLPRIGRKYLRQVVESEVLESVPFPADQVDVTWRASRNEEGMEVYALIVPKAHVDGRVALLRGAGIRPSAAYSRGVALACAGGVGDAIFVDLSAPASIVLVQRGLPRVVAQVDFDALDGDPWAQAEALARAVEQVGDYHRADPGAEPLPVLLVGQGPQQEKLAGSLGPAAQRLMTFPEPPLAYPTHFSPGQYSSNLGMAIADGAVARGRTGAGHPAGLWANLLPPRHMPWTLSPRVVGIIFSLITLAVTAFHITPWIDGLEDQVAVLASRLDILEGQERQRHLTRASATVLEKRVAESAGAAGSLDARLADLNRETETLLERLNTVTGRAGDMGVVVSSLSQQGESYLISGSAVSYQAAVEFTQGLERSGLFSDARLVRAGASGAGGLNVGFQVKAAVPGLASSEPAP